MASLNNALLVAAFWPPCYHWEFPCTPLIAFCTPWRELLPEGAQPHAQPRTGAASTGAPTDRLIAVRIAEVGKEGRKGARSPALITCRDTRLHGAGHPLGEAQQKEVSHQYLTLVYA